MLKPNILQIQIPQTMDWQHTLPDLPKPAYAYIRPMFSTNTSSNMSLLLNKDKNNKEISRYHCLKISNSEMIAFYDNEIYLIHKNVFKSTFRKLSYFLIPLDLTSIDDRKLRLKPMLRIGNLYHLEWICRLMT